MRFYVSGPMTGLPEMNFPAFKAAAKSLRDVGYEAIDPSEVELPGGATWADYMRVHLVSITQCDGIYMLPGWQNSKGARLEHHVAEQLGLVVKEEILSTPNQEAGE